MARVARLAYSGCGEQLAADKRSLVGDRSEHNLMRRPHVFERSAPRGDRTAYRESANPSVTARLIAAQLGSMIDKANGAGLVGLGAHLEVARLEAERAAATG